MSTPEDLHSSDDASRDEIERGQQLDTDVQHADAGPVDDTEAQAAADGLTVSDETAATYKDALERGAHQAGEGAVP